MSSDEASTSGDPQDDPQEDPQDDVERFAAVLDGRTAADADDEPAHEIALARRLAAAGSALDPEPGARERARQRLLAALAREAPGGDDAASGDPSRAS